MLEIERASDEIAIEKYLAEIDELSRDIEEMEKENSALK